MSPSIINKKNFQETQSLFCKHLRLQAKQPLPDNVTKEQMDLYQSLNFGNMLEAISPCFPVAKSLVSKEDWHDYVKAFIKTLSRTNPFFNQLPYAFLQFMQQRADIVLPEFYLELLHYEWLELYIELLDVTVLDQEVHLEALDISELSLSPLAEIAYYHYPLDKVSKDFIPKEPEDFYVAVYRDADDKVNFLRLNQLTYNLIQDVLKEGMQLDDWIDSIDVGILNMKREDLFAHAVNALQRLISLKIVTSRRKE